MSVNLKLAEREVVPITPLSPIDAVSPNIYRQLYASLMLRAEDDPIIGVTSAIAGEGRTTIALGLARTLAGDLEVPVSLVEIDLGQPSLGSRLGLPLSPGLAEVLRGEQRLADVQQPVAQNLSVITSGVVGNDMGALLHQLPIEDPIRGPHGLEGVVILDLPPILAHGYSALAASIADALLLVVRAEVTPAQVIREAIARLDNQPPRGVVFNGPRSSRPTWWPHRRKK